MILRRGDGTYQIYDIGNNVILGAFPLGQVGADPIEGYFPAVVDREVFDRIASRAKTTAPRGRNALNEPASIFAGLMKCARCGGSVIRVSKGAYAYLVCSKAHNKSNGCKYLAVPYDIVEDAVRRNAGLIFKHAPRGRGGRRHRQGD
jgi:Recombinase zinc beta ribbon domain